MIKRSICIVILGAALLGVEQASARVTYTYLHSGYCPGTLRHVRNVRICGQNLAPVVKLSD
jgi:hypothetical protein